MVINVVFRGNMSFFDSFSGFLAQFSLIFPCGSPHGGQLRGAAAKIEKGRSSLYFLLTMAIMTISRSQIGPKIESDRFYVRTRNV